VRLPNDILGNKMLSLIINKHYLVEGCVCRYDGSSKHLLLGKRHKFIDEFGYCHYVVDSALAYVKPWVR